MSEKTLAEQQIDALVADARAAYPTCTECGEDIIPNDGEVCGACVRTELAAAEERGRRRGVEEERRRAMTVVHILHQCIRGKCACTDNGAISQFACEDTARKAIDAWTAIAPRDSAPAAAPQAIPGTHAARREREKARDSGKEG